LLNFLSCRYFQQRGWHLLEGKFVNKGDNAIGGNIHTPIDDTHLHVFVSYKNPNPFNSPITARWLQQQKDSTKQQNESTPQKPSSETRGAPPASRVTPH